MASPTRAALLAELRRQGIVDERVLAALAAVPRELFVEAGDVERAYENVALSISDGQTISQPFVVALMAQALMLTGRERVLEIGAGSGYGAAVLTRLAAAVVTVERHPALADAARRRLAALGYPTVQVVVADGSLGWPAGAPYDAIVVTAAAPAVPPALLDQLDPAHGRLIIPVGGAAEQRLLVVRRRDSETSTSNLGPVRFVPLIGQSGWSADAWPDDEE